MITWVLGCSLFASLEQVFSLQVNLTVELFIKAVLMNFGLLGTNATTIKSPTLSSFACVQLCTRKVV